MDTTRISARLFSGQYIAGSNDKLLEFKIECGVNPDPPIRPITISLLVDISGSMSRYEENLIAVLLAFDDAFRSFDLNVNIVTFSSSATVLFRGKLDDTYRKAVSQIACDGFTNYEDVLEKAVELKKETEGYHFSIFFTDGEITQGKVRTPEQIKKYIQELGDVATIGMGNWYSPRILRCMGEFTPTKDIPEMNQTIAAIVSTLVNIYAVDVKLTMDVSHRTVVGSSRVGRLFPERVFYWTTIVEKFEPVHITMKGKDLTLETDVVLVEETTIPDDVLLRYYEASSFRLLQALPTESRYIKERIDRWLPVGKEIKEKVLYAIESGMKETDLYHGDSVCFNQLSYSTRDTFTQMQQTMTLEMHEKYTGYF